MELLPLSSVAHIAFGIADTRHRAETGVSLPIVNLRHVQDGLLPPSADLDARVVPAGIDISRYTIRDRDVLVTSRGTQLRVGLVTPASTGALISAHIVVVRTREFLLPEVLLAFLRSAEGKHALHAVGRSSTGLLSLKRDDIAQLQVPVPSLDIQRRLAELVQASEQHHRAALDAAERRRAVAQSVVERVLRQPSIGA